MPPSHDAPSTLLSAVSSSFVWDETQEIACFLVADEVCFLSIALSFIWDHCFCLGSSPMVYCLLLYKTFSQEAGSVVAISLSRWSVASLLLNQGMRTWLWCSGMSQASSTWFHWLRWIKWLEKQVSGNWPHWFGNCSVFLCLSSWTSWDRTHPCLYDLGPISETSPLISEPVPGKRKDMD